MFHRRSSKSERQCNIPPLPKQVYPTHIINTETPIDACLTEEESGIKQTMIENINKDYRLKSSTIRNILDSHCPGYSAKRISYRDKRFVQVKKPDQNPPEIQKEKTSKRKCSLLGQQPNKAKPKLNYSLSNEKDVQSKLENSLMNRKQMENDARRSSEVETRQAITQEPTNTFIIRKTTSIGIRNKCPKTVPQQVRSKVQSGFIKYTQCDRSLEYNHGMPTSIIEEDVIEAKRKLKSQPKVSQPNRNRKCLSKDSSLKVFRNQIQQRYFRHSHIKRSQSTSKKQISRTEMNQQQTKLKNINKHWKEDALVTPIITPFIAPLINEKGFENAGSKTRDYVIKSKSKCIINAMEKIREVYGLQNKEGDNTNKKRYSVSTKSVDKPNYIASIQTPNVNEQNISISLPSQEKKLQKVLSQTDDTTRQITNPKLNNQNLIIKVVPSRFNYRKSNGCHQKVLENVEIPDMKPRFEPQVSFQEENSKSKNKDERSQVGSSEGLSNKENQMSRKRKKNLCKIGRVLWGKSKQNQKKKILGDISMQQQNMYANVQTNVEWHEQFDGEMLQLESQFCIEKCKLSTVNLYEQLVSQGNFELALSNIAHDESEGTPLNSLQELYQKL